MKLKKLSSKVYNTIKLQYPLTYSSKCNEEIARRSNLQSNPLYDKLINETNSSKKHYVFAIIDTYGNCYRPGWSSLTPFDYWINFLKTVEDITQVKDVVLLHSDLDKKEAIRISRELKESILQIGRQYKISKILN